MGFSETAFVVPLDSDRTYGIRYFTPLVEVDLCGHATLASGYLLTRGENGGQPVVFRAAGGELAVAPAGPDGLLWMDFPAEPPPVPTGDEEGVRVCEALGVPHAPQVVWRGRFDLMVRLASAKAVFRCRPSAVELAGLDARGVIITAPADGSGKASDFDFVSRYFAPRCGIAEDPVTGSAHCLLGCYWARELGSGHLVGYQASDRGGLVHVSIRGAGRIGIGGRVRMG
ncbi:hypothetical protein BH23VER1_BH23VER1_13360 [soil metagenome]